MPWIFPVSWMTLASFAGGRSVYFHYIECRFCQQSQTCSESRRDLLQIAAVCLSWEMLNWTFFGVSVRSLGTHLADTFLMASALVQCEKRQRDAHSGGSE